MYELTLTYGERMAFDFVGHRYGNGDQMSNLIWAALVDVTNEGDEHWETERDDHRDLTFKLSEPSAWVIRDLAEEDDFLWPCFAPELASKMQAFCDRIV